MQMKYAPVARLPSEKLLHGNCSTQTSKTVKHEKIPGDYQVYDG
jgi:hypothetical protein